MRRRTFLQKTFWGTLLSYISIKHDAIAAALKFGSDNAIIVEGDSAASPLLPNQPLLPNHVADIIRPDDLLNLRFEFSNLAFLPQQAMLKRIDSGKDAHIKIYFPPQHIAEQAFDINLKYLPAPPVGSHIGGDSRLVFLLPKGVNEIPYELPALLSWTQWKPSVAPAALPPDYAVEARVAQTAVLAAQQGSLHTQTGGYALRLPKITQIDDESNAPSQVMSASQYNASAIIRKAFFRAKKQISLIQTLSIIQPGEFHTAIEAPTRLILSPHVKNAWAHAVNPVSRESEEKSKTTNKRILRTELWHTRLGVLDKSGKNGQPTVNEQNSFLRTVRAIWSPDYQPNAAGTCGSSDRYESLTAGERNQIVHLSTDQSLDYARPVQANRLMLSALGAWLDLRGDWELPAGSSFGLESWTHRTTSGRDQFVRVVCKGYLFPFGHRASLITITERDIEESPVHGAYLRFRQFVVVREPEKQYAKEPTAKSRDAVEGRTLPFQTVRLKTLVTPSLNPLPDKADGWLMVDKQDFLFKIEAEDWDGRRSEFTAPLNFIHNNLAECSTGQSKMLFRSFSINSHINLYNQDPSQQSRRERPMAGQKIAYAPSLKPGDTSFETEKLVLGGGLTKDPKNGELLFYPLIQSASVRLAAASQLTGNSASITFSLFENFVANGFGAGNDKGQIFAKVPDAPALKFPTERAGGLATPDMNIRGLSRQFGIVGGTADDKQWEDDLNGLAKGQLPDPDKFFSRFFNEAKLLGAVSLADIIAPVFNGGKNIPRIQSMPVYDATGALTAIKTHFIWQPSVQDHGVFIARKDAAKDSAAASFTLSSEITMPLDGKPATSLTTGELRNFYLDLLGGIDEDLKFMHLKFGSVHFTVRDRQKMDFSATGLKVEFLGALQFLRTLEEKVHADDFSDPPSLDVTTDGVRLGYTLRLPSVTAGLFALENIAFSSHLMLPFTGAPLGLKLAFSERDNPFTMTYTVFAGGGFFGIQLGPDGLHSVEAALEFGGNLSLNLGVASGKAYLMVGIYFKIEEKNHHTIPHLSGYVRSGAALEVLGLIAVSVQFQLKLNYEPSNGNATGSGTVTVEVDVAFFSKSVDLTLTKSFKGEGNGNTGMINNNENNMLAQAGETHCAAYWDEYCAAFAEG
jgi:hypothetical protein